MSASSESSGLFGSGRQQALIYIGGTRNEQVQLGEIVRRAWRDSRLSVTEWNNLPDSERDSLINQTIGDMVAEANS